MKLWAQHLLAILVAAILAAGCSGPKGQTRSGIDTPEPIDESSSTQIGNPAVSLKAQNLAVTGKIVQRPASGPTPAQEPAVVGQHTLTWDPPLPPADVHHYAVMARVGESGTPMTIEDNIPPDQRQMVDYRELAVTMYYLVRSYDANGNFGDTDWVRIRITTFCDYPKSGWSMVWPLHGCAPFESVFALDPQTTYFAGPKLIVRHADVMESYQTIDIGEQTVLKDVCAVDRDHAFAVGYAQAPRQREKRGIALSIVGGMVKHIDLAGIERGPLLRLSCDSADRFYAVGARGTALACSQTACAPLQGVDDPNEERPYAAIWGIPGRGVIIGATLHSLVTVRPDAPPLPLTPQQAAGAADRPPASNPAVLDLWGGGGIITPQVFLLVAAEDGLFLLSRIGGEGILTKIDDGRYRRLWGSSIADFYAVGNGIAHFRADEGLRFEKSLEGPALEFTSIDGTGPDQFYLTDTMGLVLQGDGQGHFDSLLNVWRGALKQGILLLDRKRGGPRITGIVPVGQGRLAISFRGADEGLFLFSPADMAMQPIPEFHDADVLELTPVGDRILISSSRGLFAMAGDQRISMIEGDYNYSSAWDCGAKGICAVRRAFEFSPKEIVVVKEGTTPPTVERVSPGRRFLNIDQAWGSLDDGLFAITPRLHGDLRGDALLVSNGLQWLTAELPAPPAGTEWVELRIVSEPPEPKGAEATPADAGPAGARRFRLFLPRTPREWPTLLARYRAGDETTYALIAHQDGRWKEIDRGDHLRPLVRIKADGDRIFGIPDPPFETTALVELGPDDRWAVADEKFLFRWTR